MSTEIEQRVVEMRFDNKHFENNVSTTMSTLDKLKQKLHLDGATKGLEGINAAAKKVDLSAIGVSADKIGLRFNAMYTMADQALRNITNSAMMYGKRIVKSLTIDPIKSGFDEYETKMGSIQTILANTEHQGTTLDDVTAALDELNTYADKTIYNFQQMTRNIGTFTAAGVDLQKSTKSIQGIANLAAVSGSTSQQASTAMYQLSQALASGTVKLMDWNSVVNAGMGGKVFQNALIRTAAMINGSANDIEAWQKKNIDAYGSFRESLSQGAWLTAEVLTRTLEQFTMAAEEGSDEWNEFKKSLMDTGYTEKQAEEILKMANTATDAATKVKTFTQLMDTLRESAQSGWAQTWELIVGDFEEAKEFFTQLSDLFGGIIGKSADRRNTFLGEALTSNYDKLVNKLREVGIKTDEFEDSIREVGGKNLGLDGLITEYGSLEKAIRSGAISTDILKQALDKVAGTNADDKIKGFAEGLKEIERTLRIGNVGEDVKKLQTALDELGYDLGAPGIDGIIGPITEKAVKEFQKANGLIVDGIVGPETMKALEQAAGKVEKAAKEVDGLKNSCGDLIDVITEKSGRELILDSLMNVIKAIQRPLAAVGEALRDTFAISPDQLYNALEKINKFTEKFVPKGILEIDTWDALTNKIEQFGVDTKKFEKKLSSVLKDHGIDVDGLIKKYSSLGDAFDQGAISFDYIKEALLSFEGITESLLDGGETAEKVRRTFAGLFAVFDVIGTVLSGPVKLGFKVFTEVLERLGLTVLDFTAGVGDAFVRFRDRVDGVIEVITDFIVDNVSEWIEAFKETEFFKTIAGWFTEASESIQTAVDNISNKFANFNASNFMTYMRGVYGVMTNVVGQIKQSDVYIAIADGISNAFTKLKEALTGFGTWVKGIIFPEEGIGTARGFGVLMEKMATSLEIGTGSIVGAIGTWMKEKVVYKLQTVFKSFTGIRWQDFGATALGWFANFWTSTGELVKKAFEKLKEVFVSISKFLFGTETIDLPTILDVVEKFLGIMILFKTLSLMNAIVEPFDNVTDALNNLAASVKWKAIGGMFKSMALALGVFAVCLLVISKIPTKDAWRSFGILSLLLVLMAGVIATMGWFSGKLNSAKDAFSVGAGLLMLIGSLALFVYTLKQADELTIKNPGKTIAIMLGAILTLAMGIKAIGKAGGVNFAGVAAILTLVAALKSILGVITEYDEYNWAGKGDAILKMIGMLILISAALNVATRGLKDNTNATGMAAMILAMVISLKLLVGVIEDFGNMNTKDLIKGVLAISYLLMMLTGVAFILGKSSEGKVLEKGQKNVNNFTGLAVALLAVVGSIWLLSKMANADLKGTLTGLGMVIAILGTLGAVFWAIGKAWQGAKVGPIIAMTVLIAVLAATITASILILKDVPWQNAVAYMGGLTAVVLAMGASLKMMSKITIAGKNLWNFIGMMGVLGILVLGLSLVIRQMNGIPWETAIASAVGLGALVMAMSTALLIMSRSKTMDWKQMGTILISMVALTAILLALTQVLRLMKTVDPIDSIGHVTALGILLNAMSTALLIMSNSKAMDWKQMGTILISMTTITAILLVLTQVLRLMETVDPANAIGNVIALSILLNAMSAALLILSYIHSVSISALGGMGGLVAVIYLLVPAMDLVQGMSIPIGNAISLSILLNAMAFALGILSQVHHVSAAALGGMLAMTVVVAGLAVVLGVLTTLDCALSLSTALSLSVMLLAMSAVFVILGLTGAMAGTAITGALGLIAVIAVLGTAIVSIGKVMALIPAEKIEKWKTGLENFMDFFEILAEGLGSIVSGFLMGLTSGLPEIGENIKAFANSLSEVDTDSFSCIEALCNALLALTKSSFLDGLNDLIFGDNSLGKFGESIEAFATCIKDSAAVLKDITDDDVANIERSAKAGTALAKLNEAIPRSEGWLQDLIGKKDLDEFGESAKAFADCLVSYSEKVSGKNIDTKAIENSAAAAQALVDVANNLPASGGKWQEWVAGEKSLATFGQTLVDFGDCLVQYNSKVTGKEFNPDAISASATAGSKLADVAAAIPSSGGTWQEWAGEKNLGTFGATLTAFGQGLVDYCNAIVGLPEDAVTKIENSKSVIAALEGVISEVPKVGGIGEWFTGSNDAKTFGDGLQSLATGINRYYATAKQIGDQEKLDVITNSKTAITKLKEVLTEMPDADTCIKSYDLKVAVDDIKYIADVINAITTAGYDYTGLTTLSTTTSELVSMLTELDVEGANTKATDMKIAASEIYACSLNLAMLNGQTYGGIDKLKEAFDILAGINVSGAIDAFKGTSGDIASNIGKMVTSMGDAINYKASVAVTAMKNLVKDLLNAVGNKEREFNTAGRNFVSALKTGLSYYAGEVTEAGATLGSNAATGARQGYMGMHGAGQFLGLGLALGIWSTWQAVYDAGYAIGQAAVQGEKAGQESNSPSKATIRAGKWLGEGLVIGIDKMGRAVYNAGSELGGTASGSISSAVSKVADMVSSGIDAQPTIRPVLDLSDVEAGIGAIGGMFGSPMGTLSMAGRINASMNTRSQNGANGDVVNAIDRLNKKMDNLGNTYQINGVTYDDGSNVSTAVKTIVRAARIERRV